MRVMCVCGCAGVFCVSVCGCVGVFCVFVYRWMSGLALTLTLGARVMFVRESMCGYALPTFKDPDHE